MHFLFGCCLSVCPFLRTDNRRANRTDLIRVAAPQQRSAPDLVKEKRGGLHLLKEVHETSGTAIAGRGVFYLSHSIFATTEYINNSKHCRWLL